MIKLIRTDSNNPGFRELVVLLDRLLQQLDGEEHTFYAQYNKLDKINHVVVAYADTQAVGCGAIKDYETGTVEVKRMYVSEDARGKGIATSILNELETWATELNYKKCILETGIRQPEAIALYLKTGYRHMPNYGQYAGVENSVCMEKAL